MGSTWTWTCAVLVAAVGIAGCGGAEERSVDERDESTPAREQVGGGGADGRSLEPTELEPGAGATLSGLARAYASAHPQDVFGASHFGAPEPRPLELDGESIRSGTVGDDEWARATFRIVGQEPTLTIVLRRPAGSTDAGQWGIVDASTAGDTTLPCRQPEGVRELWDADATADC